MSSPLPSSANSAALSALTEIAHRLTAKLPPSPGSRGEQILERLTGAAVISVPGTEYAGLTLYHRGSLVSRAPTDPLVGDVDQLQVTLAEGPCVAGAAPSTGTPTVVGDFAAERRWTMFSAAVAAHGIRSLLSFGMASYGAGPGALNLYSTRPHAFGDDSLLVGAVFAQQAAVTVSGAHIIAGLERAVLTRDIIGQAKGILMERFGLTAEQAFDLLVESSQHTNLKLAEVARWLITDPTARPSGHVGGDQRNTAAAPSRTGQHPRDGDSPAAPPG